MNKLDTLELEIQWLRVELQSCKSEAWERYRAHHRLLTHLKIAEETVAEHIRFVPLKEDDV